MEITGKSEDIRETVSRVQLMESCFNRLQRAVTKGKDIPLECLGTLTRYYESGLWLRDYEREEAGVLPPELKRGVLSQDGLYNLLEAAEKQVRKGMAEIDCDSHFKQI